MPVSDEEDEEAIIERRRKERAAMLERLKLRGAAGGAGAPQDEDSCTGVSSQAASPMPASSEQQEGESRREATPDSDTVADEAVSTYIYIYFLISVSWQYFTCISVMQTRYVGYTFSFYCYDGKVRPPIYGS